MPFWGFFQHTAPPPHLQSHGLPGESVESSLHLPLTCWVNKSKFRAERKTLVSAVQIRSPPYTGPCPAAQGYMDPHRLIGKYWQGNGVLFPLLHAGERSQKQMGPTLGCEEGMRVDEVEMYGDVFWSHRVWAFCTGCLSWERVSPLGQLWQLESLLKQSFWWPRREFSKHAWWKRKNSFIFCKACSERNCAKLQTTQSPFSNTFYWQEGIDQGVGWWSLMLESVGYRCGACTLFSAPPLSSTTNFSSDVSAGAGDEA